MLEQNPIVLEHNPIVLEHNSLMLERNGDMLEHKPIMLDRNPNLLDLQLERVRSYPSDAWFRIWWMLPFRQFTFSAFGSGPADVQYDQE